MLISQYNTVAIVWPQVGQTGLKWDKNLTHYGSKYDNSAIPGLFTDTLGKSCFNIMSWRDFVISALISLDTFLMWIKLVFYTWSYPIINQYKMFRNIQCSIIHHIVILNDVTINSIHIFILFFQIVHTQKSEKSISFYRGKY